MTPKKFCLGVQKRSPWLLIFLPRGPKNNPWLQKSFAYGVPKSSPWLKKMTIFLPIFLCGPIGPIHPVWGWGWDVGFSVMCASTRSGGIQERPLSAIFDAAWRHTWICCSLSSVSYLFPHPGWIAARAQTGWIGKILAFCLESWTSFWDP